MNLIKYFILISILITQVICSFIPIKHRFSAKSMPIDKPIKSKNPISFCDGDVVAGQICIYKCKVCDMPRLFVMNYGSHIGLNKPLKFTLSGFKNGKFWPKR